MKKILITGMTPKQVGRSRSTWVTFVDALKTILASEQLETAMEETIQVDHRAVIPGENLQVYDKVIVFIAPHDSIAAGYRWSGLWALAARGDAIVAVDDWQYYTIQMKLTSALAADRFYRFVDERPDWSRREEVQGFNDYPAAKRAVKELAYSMCWDIPFKHILMPLFPWYDPNKIGFRLKDKDKIVPIDPSLIVRPPDVPFVGEKKRQWVAGSLFDHSDYINKLGLTWPLLKFGHKKTQVVLSEPDLCKIYAESYGIISPKYRTSGDGWWRMRYVHAAEYYNILLMSPEERANMPGIFKLSVQDIENRSNSSLHSLMVQQSKWLVGNFMAISEIISRIKEVLK